MEEKQIEKKHYYKVNHRYKDKMILPLIAVSNNIDFITTDNERYVVTADSVKCKVSFCCVRTLFQVEKDIEKIYGISAWEFLKRWYGVYDYLSSLNFFVLELKKEG